MSRPPVVASGLERLVAWLSGERRQELSEGAGSIISSCNFLQSLEEPHA